eukprot:g30761.t1
MRDVENSATVLNFSVFFSIPCQILLSLTVKFKIISSKTKPSNRASEIIRILQPPLRRAAADLPAGRPAVTVPASHRLQTQPGRGRLRGYHSAVENTVTVTILVKCPVICRWGRPPATARLQLWPGARRAVQSQPMNMIYAKISESYSAVQVPTAVFLPVASIFFKRVTLRRINKNLCQAAEYWH